MMNRPESKLESHEGRNREDSASRAREWYRGKFPPRYLEVLRAFVAEHPDAAASRIFARSDAALAALFVEIHETNDAQAQRVRLMTRDLLAPPLPRLPSSEEDIAAIWRIRTLYDRAVPRAVGRYFPTLLRRLAEEDAGER